MKIIAVTNQKGGVAKTTTATAMAAGLKKRGYRVLLIDTDPQANSTDTYRAKVRKQCTLYDVLCEGDPIAEAIQHMEAGDVVASDPLLADAEQRMTEQGREFRLKEALEEIEDSYDYVIIDTPPGLGILLTNALTAATSCIIPISADRYGLQGLDGLDKSISRVRKYSNRDLKIDGLLFCKYKADRNLSRNVMQVVKGAEEALGTKTFNTTIRETVKAQEAQAARMTLFDAAPDCTAARDYDWFLDEYLYENENIVFSGYGALQEAKRKQKKNEEFQFVDTEEKWGICFERRGVKFFIYSIPTGGLYAECTREDNVETFKIAGRNAFSGEEAQTSQSVYAYVFK